MAQNNKRYGADHRHVASMQPLHPSDFCIWPKSSAKSPFWRRELFADATPRALRGGLPPRHGDVPGQAGQAPASQHQPGPEAAVQDTETSTSATSLTVEGATTSRGKQRISQREPNQGSADFFASWKGGCSSPRAVSGPDTSGSTDQRRKGVTSRCSSIAAALSLSGEEAKPCWTCLQPAPQLAAAADGCNQRPHIAAAGRGRALLAQPVQPVWRATVADSVGVGDCCRRSCWPHRRALFSRPREAPLSRCRRGAHSARIARDCRERTARWQLQPRPSQLPRRRERKIAAYVAAAALKGAATGAAAAEGRWQLRLADGVLLLREPPARRPLPMEHPVLGHPGFRAGRACRRSSRLHV